jgi:hypothetical protein
MSAVSLPGLMVAHQHNPQAARHPAPHDPRLPVACACSQCPFGAGAQRALAQAFVRPGGKNSILAPAEFWTPPALSGPSTVGGWACSWGHDPPCPIARRPELPAVTPALRTHARTQLDAAGYRSLIAEVTAACKAGNLSPPTLHRLGFHSVHLACSVGKGWGANGGFHAFAVDYDHPSNGGLGDDIKYLLKVGHAGCRGLCVLAGACCRPRLSAGWLPPSRVACV